MINRDALEKFCKKAGGEFRDTGGAFVCQLKDKTRIAYIYDDMMRPLEIYHRSGSIEYITTNDSLECKIYETNELGKIVDVRLNCQSVDRKPIDNRIEIIWDLENNKTTIRYSNYKYGYDPFWKTEHPIRIADLRLW